MAFCGNCGHQISDLATACPQCGHPTAVRQESELAGWWLRFAAAFIDGIILSVPAFLLAGVFAASVMSFGMFDSDSRFGTGFGPFNPFSGVGWVIGFLYHWLMIGLNDGQTVGKMVCGIRIMHPDKTPVDLTSAAARAGMRIVSGIPFNLGFLWAAWDSEKRTWHDMVANTRAFRILR